MGIYLIVALIVLSFFILWFIICTINKNYGLVDIAWGLGMSIISLYLLIFVDTSYQIKTSLLLVLIWGLRLGYYLTRRNFGKVEDYRYQEMRERWKHSHPHLKAFLNVFILQAILQYAMLIVLVNGILAQTEINVFSWSVGLIIAVFGLIFEIVGDYQLKQFRNNPSNKGKLMDKGLWKITRHPNYFGEVVFWWGVFITTYQSSMSWLGIVSPLLITVLINYVSGIPLLEKKYFKREDYKIYANKTPRFIPYIGTKKIRGE